MPAKGESLWDPEREDALRRLWAEGLSGGAIARELGITKNAVVGKAHRMGLAARASPILPGGTRPRRPRRVPRGAGTLPPVQAAAAGASGGDEAPEASPPEEEAPAGPAPPPRPVAFAPRGCAWPHGDPKEPGFRFCGDPVTTPHRPYCDRHCAVAYTLLIPRSERLRA